MRKVPLYQDHYYHVYNRAVEKRQIFFDQDDYERFLGNFRLLNDINTLARYTGERKGKLVEATAYCLMPNHFHLILYQKAEGGISRLMHKLTVSYAKYFNAKYRREGTLFQGPFRANLISDDSYMIQVVRYVHTNPLKLPQKGKDNQFLKEFLCNYKWSSLKHYLNPGNELSIYLRREPILLYYKNLDQFKRATFISFLETPFPNPV